MNTPRYSTTAETLDVYLFGRNDRYDSYTFLVNRTVEELASCSTSLRFVPGVQQSFLKMHRLEIGGASKTLIDLRFISQDNMPAVMAGIAEAIARRLGVSLLETFLFRHMGEVQPLSHAQLLERVDPVRFRQLYQLSEAEQEVSELERQFANPSYGEGETR